MIYFLFAMQREADMLDLPNKYVVGIGATELPKTTADDVLVNIGYCGGHGIKVGTIIEPYFAVDVRSVDNANPFRSAIVDRGFDLPGCICFTAEEFVEESPVAFPCIFDMELLKIAKLPHRKLYALKIVSDNLCEKDCEEYNDPQVWDEIKKLLKENGYV